MMELHCYITTGNIIRGTDGVIVSPSQMFDTYVRPVAEKDFKLVPHYEPFMIWNDLLQDRARIVYETVQAATEPIAWIDADILFVRECADRLKELIKGQDLVAQSDGMGGICCGFMVYTPNDRVIEFLRRVMTDEQAYKRAITCDQEAANRWKGMLSWDILPKDEFFSSAYIIGGTPREGWRPTNEEIPGNVRIIHATSCFAWEKIQVLNAFKKMLERKNE